MTILLTRRRNAQEFCITRGKRSVNNNLTSRLRTHRMSLLRNGIFTRRLMISVILKQRGRRVTRHCIMTIGISHREYLTTRARQRNGVIRLR